MSAKLIDGKAHAQSVRNALKVRIQELQKHQCTPGLAVILVGDNPASKVYVRNKVKACEEVGIHSILEEYPESLTQAALLERIHTLNQDPAIHGILVQLPLPAHIDPHTVISAISAKKDVDAFDTANVGALMVGKPLFQPCTPYGVMRMLELENIPLRGAEAVVIGASNIVGKPQAIMLLHAGATVTICNSKTKDLAAHTKRADILVVAVGKAEMITGDMIKPGAVVIDVGMNRKDNGQLCGDVHFESCKAVASAITPVPGGVGPMTIAMLLENTVISAEKNLKGTE